MIFQFSFHLSFIVSLFFLYAISCVFPLKIFLFPFVPTYRYLCVYRKYKKQIIHVVCCKLMKFDQKYSWDVQKKSYKSFDCVIHTPLVIFSVYQTLQHNQRIQNVSVMSILLTKFPQKPNLMPRNHKTLSISIQSIRR